MKMKQGNALTKLCPMTPSGDNNDNNRCVASGCMAWRWFNADSGYCGLAGKPENTAGSGVIRKADPPQSIIDSVRNFLMNHCCNSADNTLASELYGSYSSLHTTKITQKTFGAIVSGNYAKVRLGGKIYYQGIKLK
jgi:hypothetical protein